MRILNNPFELKSEKAILISESGEKKGELKIDESQLISLLTILELKGYIKNSNGRWHRSSL